MHTLTSEDEESPSVQGTGLCDQCRSSCRISNTSKPSENGLAHDVGRDWALLERNADSGCHCCRRVVEWFKPAVEATLKPGMPDSQPPDVNADCTLSVSEHSRLSVQSPSHKRPVELLRLEPYLDHAVQHGFKTPDVFEHRYVAESLLFEESLSLVHAWLKRCEMKHADCRWVQSSRPTRLVDVSLTNGKVRLHYPGDGNDTYVALSYCWGGDIPYVCRRTNIDKMTEGIPVSYLPKTLTDAIHLTRLLGISYIWIDALCIIQDDKDDWAKEAARMSEVYSNARFTMALLCTESASAGFLHHRDLRLPHPKVAVSAVSTSSTPSVDVYIRPELAGWEPRPKPLESRAWFFQERFFSRKTLYVTNEQLLWECNTGTAMESSCRSFAKKNDGSNYLDSKSGRETLLSGHYIRSHWKSVLLDKQGTKLDVRYSAWRALTAAYSSRQLTYESDRLTAISSLARLFHSQHGDTYHAGIWSGHVREGLAWRRVSSRPRARSPTNHWTSLSPHQEHSPPSWSWAAHSVTIGYPGDDTEGDTDFTHALCRIKHIETWPTTADPYGSVSGGKVVLRGYHKRVSLPLEPPSCIWFDDGRVSSLAEVECVLLGVNKEVQYNGKLQYVPVAVAIERISGREEFRRTGLVHFFTGEAQWNPDWLDNWEQDVEVTLV